MNRPQVIERWVIWRTGGTIGTDRSSRCIGPFNSKTEAVRAAVDLYESDECNISVHQLSQPVTLDW